MFSFKKAAPIQCQQPRVRLGSSTPYCLGGYRALAAGAVAAVALSLLGGSGVRANAPLIATPNPVISGGGVMTTVPCGKPNAFAPTDTTARAMLAAPGVDCGPTSPINPSIFQPVPAGVGPDPLHAILRPAPLPKPLVLTPSYTYHTYNQYHSESNASYCLYSGGYGPEFTGGVPVGFEHHYDPGNDPFACPEQTDIFYRGAVQFDWNQVNTYVQAHGFQTATLSYSALKGWVSWVSEIDENSDDLRAYDPSLKVIPGGQSLTPAPQVSAGVATVDLTRLIVWAQFGGGLDAHMHFVFIGSDESLDKQENKDRAALLGNFEVTITPDH